VLEVLLICMQLPPPGETEADTARYITLLHSLGWTHLSCTYRHHLHHICHSCLTLVLHTPASMTRITTFLSAFLLLAVGVSAAASECPKEVIPSLEPTTQAFVDAGANSTPIYELSVPAARAFLENVQAPGSPSLDTVYFKEFDLKLGPTDSVNIHLFRPKDASEELLPVTVYFHGLFPLNFHPFPSPHREGFSN